jgi:serine/threonine protein phosphatase PrpC
MFITAPLKANQDQYTCLPQLGDLENTAFFAVYDGHGKDGDGVSGYCRDNV